MRESVDSYFLNALQDTTIVFNQFDCRTFAAFVLASLVYKFDQGQANALKGQLVSICLEQINDPNPILRKWFAICLGNLWHNNEAARWSGARDLAYEKLYTLLKDPVPEVRASTVYALGTFISSTLDRTTHANDLDRQIAMHMLECVSSDMSPLVRMELVAALQWIVKLFDNNFVDVYLREDSQHNGGGHDVPSGRDGSWKRGAKMRPVNSEKNLEKMIAMDRSPFMHGSGYLTTSSYSSIYSKLWNGIVNLSRDPNPDVALMGCKVVEHIRQLAQEMSPANAMIPLGKEVICDKISTSGGSNSFSLPPSPNTRNFPQFMNNSHHSGSTARLSESSNGGRETPGKDTKDGKEKPHKLRVPIVKTNFVEWEIGSMARPLKHMANYKNTQNDQFANETMEKKKRFDRNARVRKKAADQQSRVFSYPIKNPCFVGKTSLTPSIVKLHPYEQQIVVAYLDRIMLNDWGLNVSASLSPLNLSSSTLSHHSATIQSTTSARNSTSGPSTLRVSSIQFVNAHDRGLILAGYDDGSVRVWKNPATNQSNKSSAQNSNLITAFQALEEHPTKSSRGFGLQTAWHQSTQTIFIGGESKILRLWDAEKELKVQDISSGNDSPVSHISCSPNALFAVGFGDGSVQLFDRRAGPNESRVVSYREHDRHLLTICLRNDCETLVSGW